MKMMFWNQMKMAALAVAGVAVIGGGVAATKLAMAEEPKRSKVAVVTETQDRSKTKEKIQMNEDTHRRRLLNLSEAEQNVKACARKHFIENYLAGQVTYNLGEYPKRYSIAPTEYDRQLLAEFARHGVSLIQIHEEWNDSERRLGADEFTTHDAGSSLSPAHGCPQAGKIMNLQSAGSWSLARFWL